MTLYLIMVTGRGFPVFYKFYDKFKVRNWPIPEQFSIEKVRLCAHRRCTQLSCAFADHTGQNHWQNFSCDFLCIVTLYLTLSEIYLIHGSARIGLLQQKIKFFSINFSSIAFKNYFVQLSLKTKHDISECKSKVTEILTEDIAYSTNHRE